LAYGLSAYGLSQGLRIDVSEADQLMNKFFERFSGVRDYLKEVVIQARSKGYTETLLGRKRMLPDLNSDNRVVREIAERMALNAPIQGTAADIIKIAMVRVHNRLSESNLKARLLLQVHDELVLETSDADADAVVTLVKNEMQSAMQLKVNLDVSVGVGKSWLSAAHG
jgi:DNA polymerase-1